MTTAKVRTADTTSAYRAIFYDAARTPIATVNLLPEDWLTAEDVIKAGLEHLTPEQSSQARFAQGINPAIERMFSLDPVAAL